MNISTRKPLSRLFLGLLGLVIALLTAVVLQPINAQALTGNGARLHDPSVIKVGSCWYAYSTGFENDPANPSGSITMHQSCDSATGPWTKVGNTWETTPAWISQQLGRTPANIWAPDINFFSGQYYLYYSGSFFGAAEAVMGVMTASAPTGPWTDQGMVTNMNGTIDPDVFTAQDGTMYVNWGSFGGIEQRVIDPTTGKFSASNTTQWHLATDVEGTTMTYDGGYYYLFSSDGPCCNGVNSNYWTSIARSTSPHGPFTDMQGNSMLNGGAGSTIMIGSYPKTSAGGGDIFLDGNSKFLAYHYYDANNNGREALDIRPLSFANGWPVLGAPLGQSNFHLVNFNSRMCADVWGLSTANQAAVDQGNCNGGNNQVWNLTPVGSNFQLVNVNSNKCLEIYGNNSTPGTAATQFTCNGGNNQLWTKTTTVGTFVTFKNVNSGLCLEVYGNSNVNGAAINQWTCNGGANQQWSVG